MGGPGALFRAIRARAALRFSGHGATECHVVEPVTRGDFVISVTATGMVPPTIPVGVWRESPGAPFLVDPVTAVISFAFPAMEGMVFGDFPARRATGLDTI